MLQSTLRVSRRCASAQRVSVCLALAAAGVIAVPSFGASTNYTWNDKTGTDSNWSDAANWNPTSGPPGKATTDTATFSGTVSTFETPNLDTNESIGELVFSTAAGGWTLNDTSSSTLTLNATGTTAGIGINALGQTSGTTTINANLNIAASQTWEVGGSGTLLINGTLSGAQTSALTIAGSGTIDLTSNSSGLILSGLTINSGTLDLSGSGQLGFMTPLVLNGGLLMADNSGATAVNNRVNSFGSGMQTFLNGGNFTLLGNASTAVSEYLGMLNLGAGNSTLTVSSTTATATLALDGFTRSTGGPSVFFSGTGLGTSGSGYGQVNLASGPTVLSQGGVTAGSVDNPAVKNAGIVPYLVGEVSSGSSGAPGASGAVGSAFGTANTFMAYTGNSTNSLRPLNPVDEFTNNAIVSGNNTYITQATNASSTASVNSLVINGGTLTINSGATLSDFSGALLFVGSNSITGPGTLDFGSTEGVITVNSAKAGTISAPISGSNAVTVAGAGTLVLAAVSPNFSGTAYMNNNTLQLGNGTAGGDGSLTNSSSIIQFNNSGASTLAIDNVGAETINATIQYPQNGNNGFAFVVGPGALTLNGPLVMNSGPGAPFLFLHGGAGGGPITINGNITQVGATNQGGSYFYVATNGGVTFNDASASLGTIYYMEGIPTSVVYNGIATPTINGTIPNIVVTLSSQGSIGNGFTGNVPNANSPSAYLTISNINRAGTNVLPPMAVFNQNGPVNASGSTGAFTTTDGYYAGATVWNVNAPLAVGANFRTSYNSHLNGANQPAFGILNIAPGITFDVAPQSADSQTGYFIDGYGNYNDGSTGYIRTAAGATINADGNRSTTYLAYNAHGLLDLTNLNADGSAGAGSTLNTYYQVTMNGGGSFGGQASVTNIYPGSSLNLFSVTSTPAINNDTGAQEYPAGTAAFGTPALNLSMNSSNTAGLGDTAILNVMGGTVNNVNAVANTGAAYAAAINMYGTAANDNHTVSAMPTAVVNISNGGVVRTNTIRAETIAFNSINSDAATFVNFGGYNPGASAQAGELDFNGNGTSPTFIHYGVAGTYVYAGGAKIGTSIDNTNFTANSATITQGLMAAPGQGVSGVTFSGGIGGGYAAAPIVLIKDAQGFDATAYAVVDTNSADTTFGKITKIIVTNPGFNMSSPTLTFIGGGGTAPAAGTYTINLTGATASGFQPSGGLTKVDSGTLTLDGTYNQNDSSSSVNSITSAGAAAPAGSGNIPAAGAGNAPAGFRNNTSTYDGPTVVEAGTLALSNTSTNNNLPYSSMIVVGDTFNDNLAVLDISGTTTSGGFNLGPNQILAGFGTIKGSNAVSLSIGAATSGNNFGGGNGSNGLPSIGPSGAGSVVAPGVSAALNTIQGNASATATGALTLTSGTAGSPMTTTLGSNGTYYWKLNLSTGGTGATATPGTATTIDLSGAKWDAVVLDTAAVTATPGSPFVIQGVGIGSPTSVNIGGSNKQSYSWTIARAGDASFSRSLVANLLANTQLQLNSSGLPAPATGYGYYLSGQNDPSLPSETDLVVSYAPVPEPTALALLAPAAGAMLLRRRRKASFVQTV